MVVTPKRKKVAVFLRAVHKTNNIIALAGVSRSLVDIVKKLLKTNAPLEKSSRKPRTRTVRTPRLLSCLKKSINATPTKLMRACQGSGQYGIEALRMDLIRLLGYATGTHFIFSYDVRGWPAPFPCNILPVSK